MEPGCTVHMGVHMGPILVPYRLLAGEHSGYPSGFDSSGCLKNITFIIFHRWGW